MINSIKIIILIQFFTIIRTHFSIRKSLFQNSSHSEHNSSLCERNCGSLFIALAQHAFIDYFFQIPWIIFSFQHNNRQNSV